MSIRCIARTSAALLLLSFAVTVCAQTAPSADAGTTNQADSRFLKHAAAGGMAEVQAGKMALQKSSDAQVKQLARHIVDDHTKANAKIRELAQARQVTLPTAPNAEAQQKAAAIKALSGKSFDQAWTASMIKDHQKTIELFTDEANQTSDKELAAFANDTLPTLHDHLRMAQQLRDATTAPSINGSH